MGHSTEAKKFGGHGRVMENKMPRPVKHQLDRIVDKRRRRVDKEECAETTSRRCDHKFIDSNRCLKCGWSPYESQG